MMINREKKLVFLGHRGTGTRATHHLLRTRGFRQLGPPHSSPFDSEIQLGRGPGMRRLIPAQLFPDWEEFSYACTVRNHWDLMLSARTGRHIFTDTDQLFPYAHVTQVPMVIFRYEELRKQLSMWLEEYGLDPIAPDEFIHNRFLTKGRPKGPYPKHYTTAQRQAVRKQFQEEISMLGYSF